MNELEELVNFMRARIADDLAKIIQATQGSWKLWGMSVLADQDGTSNVETAVPVARLDAVNGQLRTFNGSFMCRFDPERMKQELKAKLELIEFYSLFGPGEDIMGITRYGTAIETLKVLSAPYSDHKDYKRHWND